MSKFTIYAKSNENALHAMAYLYVVIHTDSENVRVGFDQDFIQRRNQCREGCTYVFGSKWLLARHLHSMYIVNMVLHSQARLGVLSNTHLPSRARIWD